MSRVQIVGEERLTTEKLKERFARNLDRLLSIVGLNRLFDPPESVVPQNK